MKKTGIINSEISRVLSYMGHTDRIAVSDCGLPLPDETERIDLALALGEPPFMTVLEKVLEDMVIEAVVLAEEIKSQNPKLLQQIERCLAVHSPDATVAFVPHAEFKKQTQDCKAVIRTGENTPYANIILQSACIF